MSNDTLISKDELTDLNKLSSGKAIFDISIFWLTILITLEFSILSGNFFAYLIAFIIMGFLQNQLITWVHEASHFNLFRQKNKNDFLADLLLAGPAGISMVQYRWHHIPHHSFLGDPNKEIELVAWTDLRGNRIWFEIAKHLLGYYALQVILRRRRFAGSNPPPSMSGMARTGFVVVNSALFYLCWSQGAWYAYFALWAAPLFTLALLISNFRTIVEHQIISNAPPSLDKGPEFTRIVETNIFEQMLFAPIGFYYHYEHHLYPSIPYYNLRKVREGLLRNGHFEVTNVERQPGYIHTLARLSGAGRASK